MSDHYLMLYITELRMCGLILELPEAYLEPSRLPLMELFCENS